MERLTRRLSGGGIQLERNGGREIVGAGFMDCALVRAARERLAAYEDTGLTPEEVTEMATLKIVDNLFNEEFGAPEERLTRYEEAEADGRLVVLPCKVGTPIWRTHRVFGEASISEETFKLADLPQYGKTVFLTREEAERSLVHETD